MKEDFIYTKAGTDIARRWRVLFNYIPASEQEEVRQRWASIKAKTLDEVEEEKCQEQSHS